MTFKHLSSFAALGLVMGLMGCQSTKTENDPVIVPAVVEPTRLEGHLESRSNTKTTGHVSLQPEGEMILVTYEITGLKPRTRHGFHIHEKGDCSAPDASSAGGHWNPTAMPTAARAERVATSAISETFAPTARGSPRDSSKRLALN